MRARFVAIVVATLLLGCLVPVTVIALTSRSHPVGAATAGTHSAPGSGSAASPELGSGTSSTALPPTALPPTGRKSAGSKSSGPPAKSVPPASALRSLRDAIAQRIAAVSAPQPQPIASVAHLDAHLLAAADQSRAATIDVNIAGNVTAIKDALARLGGKITASTEGAIGATVPRTALRALAASAGVSEVSKPAKAFITTVSCPTIGCSQGVAASQASMWQSSGDAGAGIKIGIVDGGFADLASEQTAGNLPTGAKLQMLANRCDPGDPPSTHGTAVAEIVHQMAPGATLLLECVDTDLQFAAAGADMQAAGAKIVNSSLGFPGDSRGDGTGLITPDSHSTSLTVAAARKAGILWIQSAGNNAQDHWAATFAKTKSGKVVLDSAGDTADSFFLAAGGSASPVLQWDQWPQSSAKVTFYAVGYYCEPDADDDCANVEQISGGTCSIRVWTYCDTQAANTEPVLDYEIDGDATRDELWVVEIGVASGTPSLHYDLSYWGDVSPSTLSCNPTDGGGCTPATQAVAGSITEPASSPYAFAVGAVDAGTADTCGADTTSASATYPLELYSSQGPTIDGRVKPDIVAFDGVNDPPDGVDGDGNPVPFCGTSAAAPHVAGAAALVWATAPTLTASQVQAYLEQHASGTATHVPNNPPTDAAGHGVLTLGTYSPLITPPTPSTYFALSTPERALDTRTHNPANAHAAPGPLLGGATDTVSVANYVPVSATAVAINLTVADVTGAGYLSVYPGGTAFPGTSNLNYATTDPVCAVFAVVTLGAGQTISVRNLGAAGVRAIVDVVGYFSSDLGGTKYSPVTATRLLDTRTAGPNHGRVTAGRTVTVATGQTFAPGSSVVVNVTAAGGIGTGYVHLDQGQPQQPITTSTLNYGKYDRANLAIVAVGTDGTFTVTGGSGTPGASADIVIDLLGTLTPTGSSSYVPLAAPTRIIDTRTGNGGLHAALPANAASSFYAAGYGEVPPGATTTALLAGVVVVPPAGGQNGYLTVARGGDTGKPTVSTVNFTPGRNVPNAVIANLNPAAASPGDQSISIYDTIATANVVVDVFGYFISS